MDADWCSGNVYAPIGGSTQLHQAIRQENDVQINLLIDAYHSDLEKVRSYLEKVFQWDPADRIWLRKLILIASSDEHCRTVKSLENKRIDSEDIRQAVFVLLQHPIDEEEVAILHPDKSKRLSAVRFLVQLMPNGLLTWSCIEVGVTFTEAAAARGLHDVIDRLHELGAPIAIPGHNPLLSAYRSGKRDTVDWLLTRHFDDFDCTIRDASQDNALIVAIQKNDAKLFDVCLEKMIEYRVKYYNESESQAFNSVLLHETNEPFFNCKDLLVSRHVERAIEKYGIDLTFRCRGSPILVCMLGENIALEYCFEGIRNNPELLKVVAYGSTSVLHAVMRLQHFDFLLEMYQKTPWVMDLFSVEAGWEEFETALCNNDLRAMQFILENHMESLASDEEKLKAVCCSKVFKDCYQKHFELFKRYFPAYIEGMEQLFDAEQLFDDMSTVELPTPYSSFKGSKGETLLHLAVQHNNRKLFLQLLESGCDIDTLDNEGNHPIHFVPTESMLELIIERHPEGQNLIHRTNQDGFSVLHKVCALRMKDKSLISLLQKVIELGADVHQLTNDGESAAFFLTSCEALDVLMKHNIKLDTVSKKGETALLRYLQNGKESLTYEMLSHVYQLPSFKEHAHKYLEPILNNICRFDFESYPEATKLMFDALFNHSREEASKLFAEACRTATYYLVDFILTSNYDLDYNARDEYGNTPIVALLSNMQGPNKHFIKCLLRKGVDLQLRNVSGRDALLALVFWFERAKRHGHDVGTVQLLLDHGASTSTADGNGDTPLHLALREEDWELVEVLVRHGADLSVKNKLGKVPLQNASAISQELFLFLK